VAFPSGVLPVDGQVWFGASFWEPGTSLTIPPDAVAEGVGFDYVLSGEMTVGAEGPMLLARAGEEPALTAAGTEVTVRAGEAAAYLEPAAGWAGRNAGDAPLEILYLGIEALAGPASTDEPQFSDPEPGGNALVPWNGEGLGFLDATAWAELAPGPIVVQLERVTLASGASLPPHEGPGFQLVGASGAVIGQQGRLDEPLTNAGDAPMVVYMVTLAPSGLPVGTPEAATSAS
jgi:quercetin dioxygenase-like cupin family protein